MKKIVIVTGSNGRFGKYISKKLIDNKNIIPILVTSKKIKKKYYYQLNIKKVQSIKKFLFFIKKKYGEPDILINNAAVNTTSNFNDFINNSIDEKIIETYTVNSISSLFFIKFFLKSIEKNKKKEKKVINMLTRHAIWGNKRHVDYYSSKASLYNATRSLARDYPFFTFVNFMLGPIGYQKDNRHPEIIWNEIQNIIFNKQIKNYREVYFESFIFVIKTILCDLLNNLKKIKIINPKKK